MKLQETETKKLISIIEIANILKMDMIAIEPTVIRAVNADKTVLLIEDTNLPKFNFLMGISRIKILNSRFSLLKSDVIPELTFTSKKTDNLEDMIVDLNIKSKRTSISFRCSDIKTIVAPRKFTSKMLYSFNITDESIELLSKSKSAMEVNVLTFNLKDKVLMCSIDEATGDNFKHEISDNVNIVDGADSMLIAKYSFDTLLPLLKLAVKNNKFVECKVEKRGILNMKINDYTVYVMPNLK